MKKILFVLFVMLTYSLTAFAQAETSKAEMQKMHWMVGKWEGTAVIEMGPGKSMTVNQSEDIQTKLDGLVFTIEGIGTEKGKEVFHAFAVLSYDPNAKKFLMRAFTGEGHYVDAETSLNEKTFIWIYQDPRLGKVRYTINFAEQDKWHEVGEFSRDEGKTWHKFIELKLNRKK